MLNLPIEYYAYSNLINAVAHTALSVVLLKKASGTFAARLYAYFGLLVSLWACLYSWWLLAGDNAIWAETLVRTCMLPVQFFGPVFLHFSLVLNGQSRKRWLGSEIDEGPGQHP